jgi:hypothetical protein
MYSDEVALERTYLGVMAREVSPEAAELRERLNSSVANLHQRNFEYAAKSAKANHDLIRGFVRLLPQTDVET